MIHVHGVLARGAGRPSRANARDVAHVQVAQVDVRHMEVVGLRLALDVAPDVPQLDLGPMEFPHVEVGHRDVAQSLRHVQVREVNLPKTIAQVDVGQLHVGHLPVAERDFRKPKYSRS
jgi:hypothetical protein